MERLGSDGLTRVLIILLTVGLVWSTSLWAVGSEGSGAPPTLLLDPSYLADTVGQGLIFAKLGDRGIFWVDEINEQGTPDDWLDDTIRFGLWGSDGTPGGTRSLLPSELSLYYYYPDTLDGVLFFAACRARDPISFFGPFCNEPADLELWRTDGTPEGTFRLPGDAATHLGWGSYVMTMVPELGRLFFLAWSDEAGLELWTSDGTRQGTTLVKNLSDRGVVNARHLVDFDGELYFAAYKLVDGKARLWIGRSDGTEAGTTDFRPDIEGYDGVQGLAPAGDTLFLVGVTTEKQPVPGEDYRLYHLSLWGMKRGTEKLDRLADLAFDNPHNLWDVRSEAVGGRLFFDIDSFGRGPELWASDGTPSGTVRLGSEGDGYGSFPMWPEPSALPGGLVLLRLSTEKQGLEPWVSDGTSSGTKLLADICPGWCYSWPLGMTLFHDWYYFAATSPAHGWELWRWQPASGRVEMVVDLCPGECSSVLSLADRDGDRLFFRAQDENFRWHIWELLADGTSFREVAGFGDLQFGGSERVFSALTKSWRVVGDRSLFWARDSEDHASLWSMPVPSADTLPPDGPPLLSDQLPGFAVKVRITPTSGEPFPGRAESACIPETLCVSGAVPGRSEVFVRVVGPKPNGKLWPTLVKFSTSTVETWIEQLSTGIVRYYRLDGASPGSSELPGLFDREGFPPAPDLLTPAHESGL